MPYRYARAGARAGPSVRTRELCLGSSADVMGRRTVLALLPLPLPLAQAPQVTAELAGVDLPPPPPPLVAPPQVTGALAGIARPPGQGGVRAGPQPLLVAGERHPLGQDV